MHLHWGSPVEDVLLPEVEVPNSQQNKPSRWLFSRVLASYAGGPGSSPGRDMSVLGPLEEYSDDPGQVSR
jgi:hypothetical protein